MTEQEFEAWLEEHEVNVYDPSPGAFCGWAVKGAAVRALYDALRPRWIPVSERLPELTDRYCVIKGDSGCRWTDEVLFTFDKKWDDRNARWISHWLPKLERPELPPLPEAS